MSLPIVAIVGRPNVGKSSLFNGLTRTRNALVAPQAGLTRDRQYGIAPGDGRPYLLIDTGGLMTDADELSTMMARQVQFALIEADLILFVTDARDGLSPDDEIIAERLRRAGKPVLLVVNKTDGLDEETALSEFHALALGSPRPVSAAHNRGLTQLEQAVLDALPERETAPVSALPGIRIALLGRPNCGKSTLVNRLLGEERVLTQDAPGTTRDSISVPFSRDGNDYVLVDTAGVRRRARVPGGVEKLSVIKSLQAVEQSDIAMVMLDAQREISDQDAHLVGHVLEVGRGLVIVVNKWDGLDDYRRRQIKGQLERKLGFAGFAPVVLISALHGTGIGKLMHAVQRTYDAAHQTFGTAELTRILEQAVARHAPPMVGGRTPKLRYAHAGGHNPLRVIVHGNRLDKLPASYRRYLANTLRETLGLIGTPLHIIFKAGENPYAGRKNKLTNSQAQKRKRLLKHVKRR